MKKWIALSMAAFVGSGYPEDTRGWLDPTAFIEAHRRMM